VECRRVSLPTSVLEGEGGIWRESLTFFVLSRRERQTWRAMEGSEVSRTQWLLGRIAAKETVRALLARWYGLQVYPADIEIEADAQGRPTARGLWSRHLRGDLSVSLSHKPTEAFALALESSEPCRVGIDVEPVRRLEEGFEDVALSREERALVTVPDPGERAELVLRLWCAKEAVGKALGSGLAGTPRGLVAQRLDVASGVVHVGFVGPAAGVGRRPLRALTGRDGDLVFATAICEE
jgi:phosphopantetheinyl transferase